MAALTAVVLLPAAAASASETVHLDTYRADAPNNPVVTTESTLADGAQYLVTISGTYSRWSAAAWNGDAYHAICGTPEAGAVTPSPGTTAGKVGADAETQFASVRGTKSSPSCDAQPDPQHSGLIELNTGAGFAHVEPVGGAVSTPSVDHTYEYVVTGADSPLSVELIDATPQDNNGVLAVEVHPIQQNLVLNTHTTNNAPNPTVTTPEIATSGKTYTVAVTGTYSNWTPGSWTDSLRKFVCGTSEPAPLFASPFITNGQVGSDAETVFAQVRAKKSSAPCTTNPPPLTSKVIRFSTSGTFVGVKPATSDPVNHAYTYTVHGAGNPIGVRLTDTSTLDDYGQFSVVVTQTP